VVWKIWVKIFSILILAIVPLVVSQYLFQKDSIEVVFDLAEKTSPVGFLDNHLSLLKKISKFDPDHTDQYKKQFEAVMEVKTAKQDVQVVQANLVNNLLRQTLRNAILILSVSLVFSFAIARSIVGFVRNLIANNKIQSARLDRLASLESWQKIAKMVVHEIRGPITPIKLVSTDIEEKYKSMTPSAFSRYLAPSANLIREQVEAMERFIEGLTRFAKLPDVKKVPVSISEFLTKFIENYKNYRTDVILTYDEQVPIRGLISIDPGLLAQVFFNLLKNASEANPKDGFNATLRVRQSVEKTWISFANSGTLIPDSVSSKLFDLYVSTKLGNETPNLGMGLTIAKKIALDHGGDLYLAKNTIQDGVMFELELPNL